MGTVITIPFPVRELNLEALGPKADPEILLTGYFEWPYLWPGGNSCALFHVMAIRVRKNEGSDEIEPDYKDEVELLPPSENYSGYILDKVLCDLQDLSGGGVPITVPINGHRYVLWIEPGVE